MKLIHRTSTVTIVFTLILCLAIIPKTVNADVTNLYSITDANIIQYQPDNNFPTFFEVYFRSGDEWRCVVKFDLASIPNGARINSAYLTLLYSGYQVNPAGRRVAVDRIINHDWVEGDGTWGVTWKEANHVSVTHVGCEDWANGGEYTTEDEATAILPDISSGSPQNVTWDLTGIVKDWLEGGQPNYGLLLRSYDFNVNFQSAMFHPRESLTQQPILEINWDLPTQRRSDRSPVGGVITPINKIVILAPYLILVGLAVSVTAVATIVKRRRKA